MADGCVRRRQALWSAAFGRSGQNVPRSILGLVQVAQQKMA